VGDDLKIRKSRKPRGDVFGQAVGQSFEVRIAARPPERQHGDPKAFVGASGSKTSLQRLTFPEGETKVD
jgi:hypothetical protein